MLLHQARAQFLSLCHMELVQNSGDEGLIPRIAQTTPRIRGNSNAYMFIIAANTSRAERHQPDGNGYDLLILEDLRAVANAVGRTPRRGQSTAFVSSPFAIGLSFPQRCAARDQFISPAWAACLCHGAYEGARRRFARYGRPRDRQGEPPRLPRRRQIVPKHCRSDIPRRASPLK